MSATRYFLMKTLRQHKFYNISVELHLNIDKKKLIKKKSYILIKYEKGNVKSLI